MALLSTPLDLWKTTPAATRGYTAATIAFSAGYAYGFLAHGVSSPSWLLLMPGNCILRPWVFVTSSLVETGIVQFILTMLFVPASLRYLERIWSTIELLKFIAVTTVIPNIMSFAFSWLMFVVTSNESFIYGTAHHGQAALQIGILVAFTQAIPEHQVQLFGVLKMRVKQLPMLYLGFSIIMTLFGFQEFLVIQFGWLVSYLYLRFYKKSDSGGSVHSYGDHSETFAFIGWFPPFIHHPVSKIANVAHALATRFKLIPASSGDVESGGVYVPVPGGARAEAERRRAMALKALDQRLAHSATPPGAIPPAAPPRAVPASASRLSTPSNSLPKPVEVEEGTDIGQGR